MFEISGRQAPRTLTKEPVFALAREFAEHGHFGLKGRLIKGDDLSGNMFAKAADRLKRVS